MTRAVLLETYQEDTIKAALLHEHEGLRTFAVVLATGDEAMAALVITETPTHLHRRFDPESGLPLIDPSNRQAP